MRWEVTSVTDFCGAVLRWGSMVKCGDPWEVTSVTELLAPCVELTLASAVT